MMQGNRKSLRHGLACAAAVALLAGCATQGGPGNGKTSSEASGDEVAVSAVRVVVFREGGDSSQAERPVNVYIDQRYQATLIGSAYSEHILCPGEHPFAVAFEDPNTPYDARQAKTTLELSRDAVQYVRIVTEEGAQPKYATVSAEQAMSVLETLDYEPHADDASAPSVNCAVP